MRFNPEIHHRRSIRLRDYDYSKPGAYFVTICTHNRECLFGELIEGKMKLNDVGKMIEKWYLKITEKFPDIKCGEYVIMPNHFHCIIHNVGADLRVCPENVGADVGEDPCVCPDNEERINGKRGQKHRFTPTNMKLDEHKNKWANT